jgi:hypothetical protein
MRRKAPNNGSFATCFAQFVTVMKGALSYNAPLLKRAHLHPVPSLTAPNEYLAVSQRYLDKALEP